MDIVWKILFILCCFSSAYGQNIEPPSRWIQKKNSFYGVIEGIIFSAYDTRFISQPASLTAGDKALEPTPALVVGYRIN